MNGNNPNTAALPYDVADLPLLYEAVSLGVATAMCSGDPAGRAALSPYAESLRALMPAIAFHFEPSDWSTMIKALRACQSWSVTFDPNRVRHQYERDEADIPIPVRYGEVLVRAGEGVWRTRDALRGGQHGLPRDRLFGFRHDPEILEAFKEALTAHAPLEARFEESPAPSQENSTSTTRRRRAS